MQGHKQTHTLPDRNSSKRRGFAYCSTDSPACEQEESQCELFLCVTFCSQYDMDLRDERELAYQRLLRICHAGFLSIWDFRCDSRRNSELPLSGCPCPNRMTACSPFRTASKSVLKFSFFVSRTFANLPSDAETFLYARNNPLNIFALHEVCAWADVSMATKCTVHVNLFGGRRPPQATTADVS